MHTLPYSRVSFFIRRMDTKGFLKAPDVPAASIPLVSFVYLTDGELLFECGGESLLCYTGQLILVPQGQAFSIPYYKDCTGYTGAFSASFLPDARVLQELTKVLHKAFWFDDAVFVGELFNMLALAFERGDETFAAKGLDLLLHMAKLLLQDTVLPVIDIASAVGFEDQSYFSRFFRQHTGLTPVS